MDDQTKPTPRHSNAELHDIGVHYVTMSMLKFVLAALARQSGSPEQFLNDARANITKDLEISAGHPNLSEEERQLMIERGRGTIDWVFDAIKVKRVTAGPPSRN